MERSEVLYSLRKTFENAPWFYDADVDSLGRYVVYANYMNADVLSVIPEKIDNKQVLCHFASNKTCSKEKFILNGTKDQSYDDISLDLKDLIRNLNKMRAVCGNNIMSHIFMESHDGINAITNLSIKYPEIRNTMDDLYQKYGFDLIWEQLEEEE